MQPVTHLNLNADTRTIAQTLTALLQNTGLCFRQMDNHILLEHKEPLTSCEIKGTVVTAIDKMPLANASVFLSNATIGTHTGSDGAFSLPGVKPGKYELIISVVGYDTYRQDVIADSKQVLMPAIAISSKTIVLTEVKVDSRVDPDREKNYTLFKNEFLGSSPLAAGCKILNPELLDLNYDYSAGILTASSEDFLEIENDALGYKIKYLLTNFIKNVGDSNLNDVQFGGPALFQEMRGNPAQEKRWRKQRAEEYDGSMMHFLRSVLNNSYEEEGFRVLRIEHLSNPNRPPDTLISRKIKLYLGLKSKGRSYKDSLAYWLRKNKLPATIDKLLPEPLKQEDLVRRTNQKDLFALAGDKCSLYVFYSKSHHYPAKIRTDDLNEASNDNRTIVNFDAPYVLFDKNGCVMDPSCLSFDGAWGRSRVADLLPVDYDPAWIAVQPESNTAPATKEIRSVPVSQQNLRPELIKLKTWSDSVAAARSSEKPYLQMDKPWYLQGDTIWFKAYLVNAASLMPSGRSAIMYVDIATDSNRIAKTYSFPVVGGITWGNISLDERTFPPGTYTIRAYTNWMRNSGEDFFFTKSFYLAGTSENNWLVSKQVTSAAGAAAIHLRFSDLSKSPQANIPVSIQAFDGDKRLLKQVFQSDKDGALSFSVPTPSITSKLKIVAQDGKGDKKVVIPVQLNRYINADVQFLPEGGALVSGLPARVGVKAVGEDGKGVDVDGTIFDSQQNQVAEFKTMHGGMGSFGMLVESEGTYITKVNLPDGSVRQFQLPAVKSSGTVLLVKSLPGSDSLNISVGATNDVMRAGQKYYFIARARGIICYAALISFQSDKFIRGAIPKNLFPTGMVHFTLMTADRRPVNERAVYVDLHDRVNLSLTTHKTQYGPRDSISLTVKATDGKGNPLKGNFSMAITNDQLVDPRSLNDEDILAHLSLTSDIKGYVENPGYYFSPNNADRYAALDNLLLTQGWVGYDWERIFNPPPITYQHEGEFTVTGNVQGFFNKSLKGTRVTLFSKSPLILMDTVTNNDGNFVFNGFPRVDTPLFLIKAVNRKGKSENIGVTIDERTWPAFTVPVHADTIAWNVNADPLVVGAVNSNKLSQQTAYVNAGGHVLKEVKVTATKVIKGSENLNGSGKADLVLDEKDMENAGKKNFLQLLEERVKGFHEQYIPRTSIERYYINGKIVIFLVDGIKLSSVLPRYTFLDIKDYLEAHTAEDLKGMEVMHSAGYAWTYASRLYPMADPELFAFVEITTRSGHGPVIDNTPGVYLYKPLALSWPKQFYKPKYTVKDTAASKTPAFRSTIDWEPNIDTDEKGEATISFFAGDQPTSYTYIIEGTDMNGNFGYRKGQIIVGDGRKSSVNAASK